MLADCCDKVGAKLIHISTDCVFSGKKGDYIESDVADEVSAYGRTKLLGEVTHGNHLTIRTSIIGPELKSDGIGLFHWFMYQQGQVSGYAHVMWSGVTTIELAKAIDFAAKQDISGLLFLSNNTKISKYDLLGMFNKAFRNPLLKINRENTIQSDKSFLCTRDDFVYNVPDYQTMVELMKKWMFDHKNWYQQYFE